MKDMREALASGRVTASMLADRAIERAEAINPQLNFIAWPTFDRARVQARERAVGSACRRTDADQGYASGKRNAPRAWIGDAARLRSAR